VLGVFLAGWSLGGAGSSWASTASVPSFGHVFLIVGENKSLFQLNISNAPYIMNTLQSEGAWFTNYNDVAKGSLADYVALTSGQYAPCQTKGPCGKQNFPSIFSQLGDGGWVDWNESMPANCYPSTTGSTTLLNAYKVGHNPALYYTGLPCATYDEPTGGTGPDDMSTFNAALATGNVPAFNFINPNLCEDSYHSCNGAPIITEYDQFLQKEIPLIEASPAFGSNSVIFATYDEGYEPTADPNTMMVVVGPQVQPGTYSGYYDHYSTVATIEQGLGLPCLANACTANALPVFSGNPPPSVSITAPADATVASGTAAISGTSAAQGSAGISQVQVAVDNGAAQPATGTTDWSYNLDTTTLSNGIHTVIVTATDTNGLKATSQITLDVENPDACPTVPAGTTEHSGNVSVEATQTGWTGRYNSNSLVTDMQPLGGSYDGTWGVQVQGKAAGAQAGLSNASPMWVSSTTQGTAYNASTFVQASTIGENVSLTITEKTSSGTKVGSKTTTLTLNDTNWHQLAEAYTSQGAGDVLAYSVHAYLASTSQSFLADCLSLRSSP
jgi:hypothetical protein